MKKTIFILLFCLMFVLVGCGKKQPNETKTVNVEVVDGYELEVVKGDNTVLEFYVIVKLENSKDDNLFKVNVPVKNSLFGINSFANYPKGTLLNVEEDKLMRYEKVE
jgi:hypothetical protein